MSMKCTTDGCIAFPLEGHDTCFVHTRVTPAMNAQIQQCCTWDGDADCIFQTACGNAFVFDSGGVKDNGFKFCPYCSKPIAQLDSESTGNGG